MTGPAPALTLADLDDGAVDGAEILSRVCTWLSAHVAFPSASAAVAATLWAAHTHLFDRFDSTPRLALLSAEPHSGKTRTIEVLELLCAGAETLTDASPSYLFRRIGSEDAEPVTLLVDECDALWKRGKKTADDTAEAVRAIINSGHRRGSTVGRIEMQGRRAVPTRFPVFAPAALAGIGNLPDTVLDRSIVIRMRRRARGEVVRPFRARVTGPEGEALREELAGWAAGVASRVGDPWPVLPDGVTDRCADCWEPVISCADLAGGPWPALARAACLELTAGSRDEADSAGVQLLADIRSVWPAPSGAAAAATATADLLGALVKLDEAGWGDWRGRPLDARGLAGLLRPYGISSRQVRLADGRSVKGYRGFDFADAFTRYLPPPCPRCQRRAERPGGGVCADCAADVPADREGENQ